MPYSNKEQLAEGRRLEQNGHLEKAITAYRKLVDKDPRNQEAVSRLLVIYRKQKDYRSELAVIDQVLVSYREENKAREEKWMREHSGAAAAGRAIYRQLGGASISGFGVDPEVISLTRRKEVVERKLGGKKSRKKASVKPELAKKTKEKESTIRKAERRGEKKRDLKVGERKQREVERKQMEAERKQKETERKQKELERKQKEERRKRERLEEKEAARLLKAQAAENRNREAAEKKQQAAQRKQQAAEKKYPTLFVILLRYTASLKEIDAAMKAHVAFLDRHYEKGDFLVSGRQEPRTGGVIFAKGRDRETVERTMKSDPFVKAGLADAEVVEFRASRTAKGMARYFSMK